MGESEKDVHDEEKGVGFINRKSNGTKSEHFLSRHVSSVEFDASDFQWRSIQLVKMALSYSVFHAESTGLLFLHLISH